MKPKSAEPICFVLPEDPHSPSGGNLFNTFLIEALKDLHIPIRLLTLAESHEVWRRNEPGHIFVDSLLLRPLSDRLESGSGNHYVFIMVHQLEDLVPEYTRDNPAACISPGLHDSIAGFLVTSDFSRQALQEHGWQSKPIFVVKPALCIRPDRDRKTIPDFIGLLVANLVEVKGVLEFLRSLACELAAGDTFRIRIAGRCDIEPEYAQNCLQFIVREPLLKGSVRYLGPVSLPELKSLYESSSLLISASRLETFGMAVQEARAFGLPVLARDAGNLKAHITSADHGRLYPTAADLAAACLDLIRHPPKLLQMQDSAWRARLIEDYDWSQAARSFLHQLSAWTGSL